MGTQASEIEAQLIKCVHDCRRCSLGEYRTTNGWKPAISSGPLNAKIMFIGEACGEEEALTGTPFVGASGKRLTAMLEHCFGLRREQVYVANIIKCRPPNNRPPEPEEIRQCIGYLNQQIMLVQPKVIVTLGRVATHSLLDVQDPITKIRGKKFLYGDIVVVPTTHPSFWLRRPSDTFQVVEDMKLVTILLNDSAN